MKGTKKIKVKNEPLTVKVGVAVLGDESLRDIERRLGKIESALHPEPLPPISSDGALWPGAVVAGYALPEQDDDAVLRSFRMAVMHFCPECERAGQCIPAGGEYPATHNRLISCPLAAIQCRWDRKR